jgi:site-specific recombinase XerD
MGMLRERMKADLKIQNLRRSTQEEYLRCCHRFAAHYMRSPVELDKDDVRGYLLHLLAVKKLNPSSVKVQVAALKFLYRVTLGRPEVVESIRMPRVPRKLPDILSGSEVEKLLGTVESMKYRAILMTAYGSGLRISEACRLRFEDIDSKRMIIQVRDGKGGHDRSSKLGDRLLNVLREYYRRERPTRPYLFPGQKPGKPISSESVRKALRKAVEECGITKRVTPHVFRHSFATHLHESGNDIRTIQVLLGHKSIRTTQLYAQVSTHQISRTKSPLDLLGTKEGEVLG